MSNVRMWKIATAVLFIALIAALVHGTNNKRARQDSLRTLDGERLAMVAGTDSLGQIPRPKAVSRETWKKVCPLVGLVKRADEVDLTPGEELEVACAIIDNKLPEKTAGVFVDPTFYTIPEDVINPMTFGGRFIVKFFDKSGGLLRSDCQLDVKVYSLPRGELAIDVVFKGGRNNTLGRGEIKDNELHIEAAFAEGPRLTGRLDCIGWIGGEIEDASILCGFDQVSFLGERVKHWSEKDLTANNELRPS